MPDINIPKPTLFSKPGCVQCNAVKRFFTENEIPFQYIDVSESVQGFALVSEWGYKQVPVVYYNFDHFSGFDPDRLKKIKEAYELEPVEEAVAA